MRSAVETGGKSLRENLPGAKGESLGRPSCPSQPGAEGGFERKTEHKIVS